MNREPKVRAYGPRPRASVPPPDRPMEAAAWIGWSIAALLAVHLLATTLPR